MDLFKPEFQNVFVEICKDLLAEVRLVDHPYVIVDRKIGYKD
jgi:hypothetical protein